MQVYHNIHEMIGRTPMMELTHMGVKEGVHVYVKLELMNPAGSVKDRVGMYMLEDAERRGVLKPGGTIVEATAGNTGIGIALAALNKGYRIIFAVPEKFSMEKLHVMEALGAEIVHTSREEGMLGAEKKAEELLREIPGAVSLRQFRNPSNPLAHYETTGPEIYDQMDGKIDYLVAGAGSGGTFSGIMKYLKEKDKNIKGVLADPIGSIIGGGEHADYNIEGIGNDFIADTMDVSFIDKVVKLNDDNAFSAARELAKKEGILAGSSSGAAVYAALEVAKTIDKGNIVAVLPDRGDRYISKGLF